LSREDTASSPDSTSRLLHNRKVSQKAGGGLPFSTRQETVWFRGLLCGVAISKANEGDSEMKSKAADSKREPPLDLRHDALPSVAAEATSATAARPTSGAFG